MPRSHRDPSMASPAAIRSTCRLTLVALLALAALSCQPPPTVEELPIGLVLPGRGELLEVASEPARAAATLAVQRINEAGGVTLDGRPSRLVLAVEDNQDLPEGAIRAARKLINQRGVVALVGPIASRNALAMATVADSKGIPMISPTASHPGLTTGHRFVFTTTFPDALQGRILARFAKDHLEARSAAILYDAASAHNDSFAEVFRRTFEEAGGRVRVESYASGEQDFRPHLERIRAAAPDVLLLPNYVVDSGRQVRQARQLGLEATILGSDSWGERSGVYQEPLELFEGAFFPKSWYLDLDTEASRRFVRDYETLHGQTPNSVAALTYDAFGLLARAISRAGSAEGEAIRRELAATEGYEGVTGTFSFHSSTTPARDVFILCIKEGEVVLHKRFGS